MSSQMPAGMPFQNQANPVTPQQLMPINGMDPYNIPTFAQALNHVAQLQGTAPAPMPATTQAPRVTHSRRARPDLANVRARGVQTVAEAKAADRRHRQNISQWGYRDLWSELTKFCEHVDRTEANVALQADWAKDKLKNPNAPKPLPTKKRCKEVVEALGLNIDWRTRMVTHWPHGFTPASRPDRAQQLLPTNFPPALPAQPAPAAPVQPANVGSQPQAPMQATQVNGLMQPQAMPQSLMINQANMLSTNGPTHNGMTGAGAQNPNVAVPNQGNVAASVPVGDHGSFGIGSQAHPVATPVEVILDDFNLPTFEATSVEGNAATASGLYQDHGFGMGSDVAGDFNADNADMLAASCPTQYHGFENDVGAGASHADHSRHDSVRQATQQDVDGMGGAAYIEENAAWFAEEVRRMQAVPSQQAGTFPAPQDAFGGPTVTDAGGEWYPAAMGVAMGNAPFPPAPLQQTGPYPTPYGIIGGINGAGLTGVVEDNTSDPASWIEDPADLDLISGLNEEPMREMEQWGQTTGQPAPNPLADPSHGLANAAVNIMGVNENDTNDVNHNNDWAWDPTKTLEENMGFSPTLALGH